MASAMRTLSGEKNTLVVAYAGARGDTAKEMHQVLALEPGRAGHEAIGKLLQSWDALEKKRITLGDVETLVLAAKQRSFYELTDAISSRDRGRALAVLDAILKVRGLPRITDNTIVAIETMWAALRVIRQRGYSFDDEEHARSTRCVGAAIYDEHAEPLGAISIAGPSSRMPDERIRHLGPVVGHIAEELTRHLGGRWPHPY